MDASSQRSSDSENDLSMEYKNNQHENQPLLKRPKPEKDPKEKLVS